jgi:quinol-cytochrome oxidoreductase complex cytochrome b subunit
VGQGEVKYPPVNSRLIDNDTPIYSYVGIFMLFTKYISFFSLTFHLLLLLPNNYKNISLSFCFLLTFNTLILFFLVFFLSNFFCHPNKSLKKDLRVRSHWITLQIYYCYSLAIKNKNNNCYSLSLSLLLLFLSCFCLQFEKGEGR